MEGEPETVTVTSLLRDADNAGVDVSGLTQWILRDALGRHTDVVTFTNPKIVAHIESFRDGDVSLLDRLESIVRKLGVEADIASIVQRLPAGTIYHPGAVCGYLRGARWCVRLEDDRYCHVDATGLDESGRKALLDGAIAALEPEDVVECAAVLAALGPDLDRPTGQGAAGVLYGLFLGDPRVQCGAGQRVALSQEEAGLRLLQECIIEVVSALGEAGPQDVRRGVNARYGYRGIDSFRSGLAAAVKEGVVRRRGSLYSLT
jgi:hypothetical protein